MGARWSVSIDGTVEEMRQEAHRNQAEMRERGLSTSDRLLVGHLLGHAIEAAADIAASEPTARFLIQGYGVEGQEVGIVDHHITMVRLANATATPATADPTTDPTTDAPVIRES